MCRTCYEAEVRDAGGEPTPTLQMRELAGWCWDWYRLPGNDIGGPLHIVLDDHNIRDSDLAYCRGILDGTNTDFLAEHRTPERDDLMRRILDGLDPLSDVERAWVVLFANPYGNQRPAQPGET